MSFLMNNEAEASIIKMAATPSGDQLHRLSSTPRDGGSPLIHRLVPDVIAEVLAGLDTRSLSSAILAHSMFWATFRAYQQRILREVLSRLIPPELLPLACITYEAASIDTEDWSLIRRLLDGLSQPVASGPPPRLSPLTFRAAAAMEEVHLMIKYFSADLARWAIPRFSCIFEIPRPETCTASEELRIFRAFYRFQLYCNIFGRKAIGSAREAVRKSRDWRRQTLPGMSDEDMRCELECFFWPWPPWVNEQLACVFEYLETKISVFFDEVSSHDVEWGWRKVDWIEPTVAIPHRRFLLLSGLPLPYRLTQSDDFETWKRLLDSADVYRRWNDEPVITMANSLADSASPRIVKHASEAQSLGQYDMDQLQSLVGQTAWAGIDDAATLPVKLWLHSHYNKTLGVAVFDRRNVLLREAGYVFWDGYIGESAEILARMESCTWTFDGRLLPHELPGLQHAMRRSWRKRTAIWLEGGSGYWTDGDESRVRHKYL